jgi:long-subunit fatty acid transport protein
VSAQGGPTTLQFSFSNPGARSLGLGGAFVALADDATAAFANPAGLIQLTGPEVSVEGRHWKYRTPYAVGGRTSGEPTGIGFDGPIRTAEAEYETSALSFLSFVYPWRDWTFALSHHQSARFESLTETQGLFTDRTDDDPRPRCLAGTSVCRYPDIRRQTRLDLETTSLSVAYKVVEDFSLGLGVSYFSADFLVQSDTYLTTDETLPEGFFGPNAYASEALLGSQIIAFDDTDVQLSLGFLWFMSPRWSLGGVYRPGAELSGPIVEVSGPALDPPFPVGSVRVEDPAMPLDIPDVLGLGVAYRSKDGAWTGAFEWDLVRYSEIVESIGRSPAVGVEEVVLDDAMELRLGVEYAFLQWSPLVAIRAGVWRDPDHTIRTFEDDPLERVLLPGGEDELHVSLGAGVVFKSIQIDLAVDISEQIDTAALSFIYQF